MVGTPPATSDQRPPSSSPIQPTIGPPIGVEPLDHLEHAPDISQIADLLRTADSP
jgi:hypothetical protein